MNTITNWWNHLPPKKVAFAIACFFMCYGMYHISNTPFIQAIMIVMGLYIEYEAQYIFGLSFAVRNSRWYWWVLRAVYIGYIVIYGLSFGIGFFATEFSTQEQSAQMIQTSNTNNQARITQLYQLIADTRKDMDYERDQNGGTGDKYQSAKDQLAIYDAELKDRLNQPVSQEVKTVKSSVKDMFTVLSKVYFGLNKYIIIIIMFGYGLVMVYLSLSLKHMNVETVETTSNNIDVTPMTSPSDLNDEKHLLSLYVNAAIRDTGKLNSISKIMEITGLPLDQCLKYKDWLNRKKIDGSPVVNTRQGGSEVIIPKSKIIQSIEELG